MLVMMSLLMLICLLGQCFVRFFMIDDLIYIIANRFVSLGFKSVGVFNSGFSIYSETCGDRHLRSSHVCSVVFMPDLILFRIDYTVGRDNTYTFSYDDLIDIDIFIGIVLSKRFYE